MSKRLEARVIVVTGGGSGIGRATAVRIGRDGGVPIVADIDEESASAVANEVRRTGGRAGHIGLDVTSRDGWEALRKRVLDEWGAVHGLVNNAGVTRDRTLVKMSDEDWHLALNVNLTGVWLGCQHLVPVLKRNGGGSIVNLSSESRNGEFGQVNYAAAKAGVVGLTKTVAKEHARHQIRCNAVAPGSIDTPMVQAVPEHIRESWLPSIPLSRLGRPEEVAAAITFLLSEDSSYITGQLLAVDGGST
ncbi:SDR family NAD(P)-dependent oxidoreductase [Streptomyces sp. Inha503]|uniref:SDR family NAD(P)-dependent oxidoreductase n=1 Tax=Streptomyces sp. Inha503 TaxID=3383314 RepID=UPI00399F0ADF